MTSFTCRAAVWILPTQTLSALEPHQKDEGRTYFPYRIFIINFAKTLTSTQKLQNFLRCCSPVACCSVSYIIIVHGEAFHRKVLAILSLCIDNRMIPKSIRCSINFKRIVFATILAIKKRTCLTLVSIDNYFLISTSCISYPSVYY